MQPEPQARVLIYEDEEDIGFILRRALEKEGFHAQWFISAENFRQDIVAFKPDIIVLDILMPGIDGWQVCQRIRDEQRWNGIRILLLTALGEEEQILKGLSDGADDYLVKPIKVKETVARVKAILRRERGKPSKEGPVEIIEICGVKIDVTAFKVSREEESIDLTYAELQILIQLASRPGRAFSREMLDNQIHSQSFDKSSQPNDSRSLRNIDVHIRSLRKKLGAAGEMIQTVRGIGYSLISPTEATL